MSINGPSNNTFSMKADEGMVADLIGQLNHPEVSFRLEALAQLIKLVDEDKIDRPIKGNDVNNHIHTNYSFSPYSPSKAIWMAYKAGLATAGIMDHDSLGGAEEFKKAGIIADMQTTTGIECRADMSKTPFNMRSINNPDQKSIAYIAIHGVPSSQIRTVRDFFAPYTVERNKRNVKMVEKINGIFQPHGITLDFENDVVPLSLSKEGGSITERHLLYALSLRMIEMFGKGQALVDFLERKVTLSISSKIKGFLLDNNNPHYAYDLLGLLKGELVSSIYINADKECPDIKDILELSRKTGSISAYAYLGDVGDSVTGDKKAQHFEDSYLQLLFNYLKRAGFDAMTYMPSRNTRAQLQTIKILCDRYHFFQISGEDINSPRQQFVCESMRDPFFKNLIDSTWALIGHEKVASSDLNKGLFSSESIEKYPDLNLRIKVYKEIGLGKHSN